jgi:hypothetical protein
MPDAEPPEGGHVEVENGVEFASTLQTAAVSGTFHNFARSNGVVVAGPEDSFTFRPGLQKRNPASFPPSLPQREVGLLFSRRSALTVRHNVQSHRPHNLQPLRL